MLLVALRSVNSCQEQGKRMGTIPFFTGEADDNLSFNRSLTHQRLFDGRKWHWQVTRTYIPTKRVQYHPNDWRVAKSRQRYQCSHECAVYAHQRRSTVISLDTAVFGESSRNYPDISATTLSGRPIRAPSGRMPKLSDSLAKSGRT